MPRGNKIALLMSGVGLKQVDKDTPLDIADLDTRINVTSRNWVNTDKTIEDIFDCVAEEVVSREVTRIIRRLPIEGEFSGSIAAVLAAYAWGVAAAPTGATANEVKTITVDATGGSFTLRLVYDGITSDIITIPYGTTAARFKYLLESLDNVGFGNTTVTKLADVYTITFVGKRAAGNIPAFALVSAGLTGGAGTVIEATTTPGSQRQHNITELPSGSYQPPYTSFGVAFEDEAGSERMLTGAVLANLRFTLPENNGKITFAGDIISRNLIPAALVIPACAVIRPARTADSIFTYDGVDYTDILKGAEVGFDNGILTGDSAYTGRGVRPSRLERANRRTRTFTVGLLGGVTSGIYTEAESNPEANTLRAASLRIGAEGDSLTVNVPNALAELATAGGLSFDGESEEAVNRLTLTPTKQGATLATNVVARVPISATLLTAT